MKIFTGSSHFNLAQEIVDILKMPLGNMLIETFPDGEKTVQVLDSVQEEDVYILQSIAKQPDVYLMELLMIVDALKRSSASSITAVIPYFGYARQDRRNKRGMPITAKLAADLMEKAGVDKVITLDLHTEQVEGFFSIPVEHFSVKALFLEKLREYKNDLVVVAPDLGAVHMAEYFSKELESDFAVVEKKRISAKNVLAKALIGDVKGKDVLIVDDICSTGRTLQAASKLCKEGGAKRIFAAVVHKIGDLPKDCIIEKCYTTNTVFSDGESISVAPLLAGIIDSITRSLPLSPS